MQKLPISDKYGYTLSSCRLTEGPHMGRSLEEIVFDDPGYLQQLIDDGIYAPSTGMRSSIANGYRLALKSLTVISDPEQYSE